MPTLASGSSGVGKPGQARSLIGVSGVSHRQILHCLMKTYLAALQWNLVVALDMFRDGWKSAVQKSSRLMCPMSNFVLRRYSKKRMRRVSI